MWLGRGRNCNESYKLYTTSLMCQYMPGSKQIFLFFPRWTLSGKVTLFKKSPGFFILLVAVSSWRPFSQMFYSCNEHFECLFFVGAGVFSFLNILILNWPSDSYSAAMIPKISILSKVYVLILQWLMCWLGNLLVASSVLINSPTCFFWYKLFQCHYIFFFFLPI